MKVAIMGAGISGLACALTLEKHGIKPDIYEKRGRVGDRFINGEIFLEVLHRPIRDSISFLSENFNVYVQPLFNIKKLVILSENKRAEIEGYLGYTSIRGRHNFALEKQLEAQVSSNIRFHSTKSYEDLKQDYTHIIMSTGDADYAKRIQKLTKNFTVRLKGATYTGTFDPYTVYVWLDNRIAPKGMAYVIPFSREEANAVIAYPNYPETEQTDPGELWQRFEERLDQEFSGPLHLRDRFNITKYVIGLSAHPRIGNTFFTGNCFASPMPFLGFGQFSSILTGIYAAQDLAGLDRYEDLTSSLKKSYQHSFVLRKALETMDNQDFDTLVSMLTGKLGDRVFNTQFNVLRMASLLLRPALFLNQKVKI